MAFLEFPCILLLSVSVASVVLHYLMGLRVKRAKAVTTLSISELDKLEEIWAR